MSTFLKFWPLALTLINFCSLWVAWSLRQMAKNEIERVVAIAVKALQDRDAAISAEVKEVEGDLDELDTAVTKLSGRVEGIEHDIAQLPTKADIRGLEEQVKAVDGNVAQAQRGIDRIEGYFLQRGVGASA